MSVYNPNTWVNNQQPALNATNLNHLEAGVESAHIELEALVSGVSVVGDPIKVAAATQADHAVSVDKATQNTIGGVKVWVDDTDPLNIIGYIDAR